MATILNPVGTATAGGGGGGAIVGSSVAVNLFDEDISGSQFYNYALPGAGQYKVILTLKRDGASGPTAFLPHIGLAAANNAYDATDWNF